MSINTVSQPPQGKSGGVPRRSKRLFVKTYGCQMNEYDSDRISESLATMGYADTAQPEDADVIVLNTCHIREKAAEKVYSDLGRYRKIKEERRRSGKKTLIAVAGCVAQAEGGEIITRAPVVDIVVGPQNYHRLPDLVFKAGREDRRLIDTAFPTEEKFHHLPARPAKSLYTAFLTVQEGCDKFCTFCVVPYTRGQEYSRSVADIMEEARQLCANGVREITLLGQNVNAYHGVGQGGKEVSLAKLLEELAGLKELQRLRYTTSHPRDMTADLINAHRDNEKLMPYLHLPFQSGSDRILGVMNRKHTGQGYKDIVARLRDARPDIAISTDIIVGFPGESDADFEKTLAMVHDVNFASAYSFKYSPRPGTPAAKDTAQVPEEVKAARLQILQDILNTQQAAFNESFQGRTISVLPDRKGLKEGQIMGRSPYMQSVYMEADEGYLGQIIDVKITSCGPKSLAAVIKSDEESLI